MLVLHSPVDAPIARPFHYVGSPFARGLHRGADFASRPGEVVRAPCDGRVVWSGRSGMTLRCGGRRVTLLPLAPVVAEGAPVAAGARVGTAGGEPLHLGVRRPGDAFGYEDPERYLVGAAPSAPVAPRARPLRPPPLPRARGPRARPLRLPPPRPAPPAAAAPVRAPLAPWPAWCGLAVVLAGTATGARRARARTGARGAPARAAPRGVP